MELPPDAKIDPTSVHYEKGMTREGYFAAHPEYKKFTLTPNWPKLALAVGILALLATGALWLDFAPRIGKLESTVASSTYLTSQIDQYLETGINANVFPTGQYLQQRLAQMASSTP